MRIKEIVFEYKDMKEAKKHTRKMRAKGYKAIMGYWQENILRQTVYTVKYFNEKFER